MDFGIGFKTTSSASCCSLGGCSSLGFLLPFRQVTSSVLISSTSVSFLIGFNITSSGLSSFGSCIGLGIGFKTTSSAGCCALGFLLPFRQVTSSILISSSSVSFLTGFNITSSGFSSFSSCIGLGIGFKITSSAGCCSLGFL
ncbi:unnamed protein product [Leptidea sinapis]|uniref:Uncharacterized protein n=1 Tax=Leptidea sinapis TaxID=189913 RepID=A0A5E4QD11_9NEOP|nr:unnamed protein product [Leptidea sinapis]